MTRESMKNIAMWSGPIMGLLAMVITMTNRTEDRNAAEFKQLHDLDMHFQGRISAVEAIASTRCGKVQ
jgi:cytochrome c-type biogenesis protein CcmH/NrfF